MRLGIQKAWAYPPLDQYQVAIMISEMWSTLSLAQKANLQKYPLAVTPTIPFFDVEFADDTVLISRNAEHMQHLLHLVQQEAAKYNLHLNLVGLKVWSTPRAPGCHRYKYEGLFTYI